jgi:hypothetical protein
VAANARNRRVGDVFEIGNGAIWDTKKYAGFYARKIIIIRV